MTNEPAPTLWDVIEEHVDEAAFLLEMRRDSLQSPDYTIDEVRTGPEARLLAHVDALVVGGVSVRDRILLPNLEDEGGEPDVVTASALALLMSPEFTSNLERCVEAIVASNGGRARALADALELADRPEVTSRLSPAVRRARDPSARAALLEVLAFYGADPGSDLEDLLRDPEPAVVRSALGIAARQSRVDCLSSCEAKLQSDDVDVRNAALETAIALGSPLAWNVCLQRALHPEPSDAICLLLIGLMGRNNEHELLGKLLSNGTELPAALWAAGFAGRCEQVDAAVALLEHDDPTVVKLAGEVLMSVTGYQPEDDGIIEALEDDRDIPFEEDDLDADLAPDPSDALVQLEPSAARHWWQENRSRFASGARFIAGRVLSAMALAEALAEQPTRRRSSWARGLAAASGGKHRLDTQSLGPRQARQMRQLSSCDPNEYWRLLV